MKNNLYIIALILSPVFFNSCKEEEYSLGELPGDVEINVTQRADTSNYATFTSPTEGFIYNWEFGNGATGTGKTVEYAYPVQGEYTVKLTVYTAGGHASDSVVVIADKDLPFDSPIPDLLTGGMDNPAGKTWVVDSTNRGHMGCGPFDGTTAIWWEGGPLEKTGGGYYDDEFTFVFDQFEFIQETNGNIFVQSAAEYSNFTGVEMLGGKKGDFTAPGNLTWSFTREAGIDYITINGGGFIGFYSGNNFKYRVMSITENVMYIRHLEPSNTTIAWYQRLIVKE